MVLKTERDSKLSNVLSFRYCWSIWATWNESTCRLWSEIPFFFSGMLCSLCKKHKQKCRSGSKVWVEDPCITLVSYSIERHRQSDIHREAQAQETAKVMASQDGGIVHAFGQQVTQNRIGFLHAVRAIYWLLKQEIAHTTTYPALLELLQACNCPHINELYKVLCFLDLRTQLSAIFVHMIDNEY